MRLRTFIATSMSDAMAQVRSAMGDNAIIVSSIEGENGGFEVTAALNARDETGTDPHADWSIEKILTEKLRPSETVDEHTDHDHPGERETDLKSMDRQENFQSSGSEHNKLPFDEDMLISILRGHGLPSPLTEAIVTDATAEDFGSLLDALSYALEKRFSFDTLPIAPRHPILLVGPPGSGKTVTAAKLAARAAIEGVQADIISTDAERTGAVAQANAYGDLLNIPVLHAETVDAMGLILDKRADRLAVLAMDHREACLIDTQATNPLDSASLKVLKRQIDVARLLAGAEPILVMAATGDPRSMAEAAQVFRDLGVERMITTQLDVTKRLGGILIAAEVSRLAFAQVSTTPYLARGLVAATPRRLAQLLLNTSGLTTENSLS